MKGQCYSALIDELIINGSDGCGAFSLSLRMNDSECIPWVDEWVEGRDGWSGEEI